MATKARTFKIPLLYRLNTKTLFFVMAATLIFIFSSYFYLVNKTIMNVVAREKTQKEIATLSGSIGELEFKYITLKNSVTIDLAHSKGFQDAAPTRFLSRNQKSQTLTYNR